MEAVESSTESRAIGMAPARSALLKQTDYIEALEDRLRNYQELLCKSRADLTAIHTSRCWQLLRIYYAFRHRLLPPTSARFRASLALLRKTVDLGRRLKQGGQRLLFSPGHDYARWIKLNEPGPVELARQCGIRFPGAVIVSILTSTREIAPGLLHAMLHSVRVQTYPDWELCIADSGSNKDVTAVLDRHRQADARIKVTPAAPGQGIVASADAALALATGAYVALVEDGDTLAPFALFEIVRAIVDHPDADLLYSDEDEIDENESRREEPHFKPDWSPDLLRSYNYINHLAVYRRTLLQQIGGLRPAFEGAQDYDLVLRASEQSGKIVHIPKVLYHARRHKRAGTAAPALAEIAHQPAARALREHLERLRLAGRVLPGSVPGTFHCSYDLPCRPLVSIIIPTRDQVSLLARCLESLGRSEYDHYEILLVENHSREPATFDYYRTLDTQARVRLLTWDRPFNYAAVNNFAAEQARGEILLFLNNDVEVINADWLERLLEHALRPEVGAVGGMLYYTDDTVQHAGVVLGLGGVASHGHYRFPRGSTGYGKRLVCTQNLSAVTGACLMMPRKVFREVGGFDIGFVLAFNDIDLCVRVRNRGYLIVWTPRAELYHHESATRGTDDIPEKRARFWREYHRFQIKWANCLRAGDPYYSPNLTQCALDFSLRLKSPVNP